MIQFFEEKLIFFIKFDFLNQYKKNLYLYKFSMLGKQYELSDLENGKYNTEVKCNSEKTHLYLGSNGIYI